MKNHNRMFLSLKDATCGASAGIFTEIIFYGLDSYKVMLQAGGKVSSTKLFKGVIPVAVTGSGPSFAAFFCLYSPLKSILDNNFNKNQAAFIAATISGIPSSLLAVPADVIKKAILTKNESVYVVSKFILKTSGIRGFFVGWRANLIRDVPFATLKMTLYEVLGYLYIKIRNDWIDNKPNYNNNMKLKLNTTSDLNEYESAFVGLCSGVLTGAATCPIDCINTYMKTDIQTKSTSIIKIGHFMFTNHGIKSFFVGILPRTAIVGLGSSVFWYFYSKFHYHLF